MQSRLMTEGDFDPDASNADDDDDDFQAKFFGRSFALPSYEVSPFVYFHDTIAGTASHTQCCCCVIV